MANQQNATEDEQLEAQEDFERLRELGGRVLGATVTGPVVAGSVGYLETRFPAKDGSRMALGPVPLSALIGTAATIASIVPWKGAEQMSYVAAANFGLSAGTLMRGYGAAARAKALAAKKSGTKTAGTYDDSLDQSEAFYELTDGYDDDGEYDGSFVGDDDDDDDEWSPQERELLGV